MGQNLTDRQIKCMKLLLEEEKYRPAGYFSELLHVSNKTLLQDLNVLKEYLDGFGIALERKTGQGIYLEEKARHHRELLNDLERQQNMEKPVSVTSRRWEMLRRLLMYPKERMSILKLSEEFFVSRASIVNDFKYIENWLQEYEVELVKDADGHHIAGDENAIRRAIAAMSAEYHDPEELQKPEGHRELDETTRRGLMELFPACEIDFIEEILGELESISGCTIREPYYINLLTHILISLFRTREGKRIEQADGTIDISTYRSFEYAKGLARSIENKFGLDIGEAEIYYIYKYLISSGIGIEKPERKKVKVISEESIGEAIASDMTACISKALQVDMDKNERLTEGLLLHIRPMLNRLKYDIAIKSEILEDIQNNYGELLGLCEAAMWCMSRKYSLKEAGLDELSYIATYYQAMVETEQMEKRVLVVCHSGFGTSQLLATKLRLNFPSWKIVDVISSRQLEKQDSLKNVDLIISTVPLEVREVPYIHISAILSDKDIQNIRNLVSVDKKKALSFPVMEEQFYRGALLLEESGDLRNVRPDEKSVHIRKEVWWGSKIQVIMGIHPEEKTVIYRTREADGERLVMTYAPDFQKLLDQTAELYQMLCSPRGSRLLENCHETKDLRSLFEPFAGQELVLIPEDMICMDLEADDKETAVRRMVPFFSRAGLIRDEEAFYQDVMEREKMALTSVGHYIAVPHGKSESVIRPGIAIGRLKRKIPWTDSELVGEDERYVQMIVMFAVHPEDEGREDSIYIRMLKQVFGRLGEPGAAQKLLRAADAEEISRFFC